MDRSPSSRGVRSSCQARWKALASYFLFFNFRTLLTWIYISSTWIFRAKSDEIHRFPHLDLPPEYLDLYSLNQMMDAGFDLQNTELKLQLFCSNHVLMLLFLFSATVVVYMPIKHRHHPQFRISQCSSSASLMPDSHRHSRFAWILPDLTQKIHVELLQIHVSKVRKLKK